jgi:Fe-S oxidoreductase
MDDRSLFRYPPGYATAAPDTALDWSEWGGFAAAVEMCNNNGHCRKFDAGTMCPSYRVTRDEQHLTRGRANVLRLALSGQLGGEAMASDDVREAMALCVSCKGCRRECPTGVDMARMKIEWLYQYHRSRPRPLLDRLVAHLPRYARLASALAPVANLRDAVPGLPALGERLLGLAARRTLPQWRRDRFRDREVGGSGTHDVVLFVDTFNRYFEPENARAAVRVLQAGGYRVRVAEPRDGGRPLCCGRTFLAAGMVDEARAEALRVLEALAPDAERGVPVVGLEPSCLHTFEDEYVAMLPERETGRLALAAQGFEEFLAREQDAGRLALPLQRLDVSGALLHGHCHQKAFGAMGAVERVLRLIPELKVNTLASGCCGMAGAFGYRAEHYAVSMKMGEAALLPAVREAAPDALIVADGTSCRHQIADGAGRVAIHVARALERALVR